MSDTARPKSAGDKLAAAEVNADLPVQINAGETISVASTPQAVYLNAGDGEVYKTDANDEAKTTPFIGFAITAGSDGNACTVQKDGVVAGFAGLTIGAMYYLSGTAGAISTTAGTYVLSVGIAISATQLLIIRRPERFVVSETLRNSDDAEKYTSNAAYTKLKEVLININMPGTIRVKFDIQHGTGTGAVRLYKNGGAIGTEYATTASYVTKTEDVVDLVSGDLLQLYAKNDGTGGHNTYVANFRFYYEKGFVPPINFTNQDP